MAGSPSYMPPEAFIGTGAMPELSWDVYAFAIVLWEICTLERASAESTRCSPRLKKEKKREKPTKKPVDCGWGQFNEVVEPPCDEKPVCAESDDPESTRKANQQLMYWRPSVVDIPLPRIKRIILECWAYHQTSRPGFDRIVKILRLAVKQVALATDESTNGTSLTQSSYGSSAGSPVANNKGACVSSYKVNFMELNNSKDTDVVDGCLDEFIEIGSTHGDGGFPTVVIHRGNGEDKTEVAALLFDKTKQRKTRRRSRRTRRKRWFRWFSSRRGYESYTSDRTRSS